MQKRTSTRGPLCIAMVFSHFGVLYCKNDDENVFEHTFADPNDDSLVTCMVLYDTRLGEGLYSR